MLVGREAELTQLHNLFAKALHGERQVVFVTGEAGIGKTTLVDAFLCGVRRTDLNPALFSTPVLIAQGQCIDHYGAGEAYLPLLEAMGGLCRQVDGAQVLNVLRRVAPTWLVQLPALLDETDYAVLQQKVAEATRERMLREMVEALEVLSRERALVLVLEDVHWSDASTIDVLNLVARRREPAQLLIVTTYRPVEVIVNEHPLKRVKQELVTRGQGVEVVLGRLGADSVQRYVSQRWTAAAQNPAAAVVVYRRTEGHPLFMVQMIDYLVQQGEPEALRIEDLDKVERLIPQQLRQLLEVQFEQLTAQERQVLEVGSVAGAEFTIASVAAGMGCTEEEVEAVCETLAQRGQFIAERGIETWSDGTVSGRYGFRHTLYQEVLYQRLSESRRMRLHRLIGAYEEAGYGRRAREHAAELAVHFERGRDIQRAVQYFSHAGENAWRRSALQEAIALFTKGLALLTSLPESPERDQHELRLLLALSTPLMMTKGYTAPEVEQLSTRALALCRHVEQPSLLFSALTGLIYLHITRAEFPQAQELGARYLQLARQMPGVLPHVQAVTLLGVAAYHQGEFVLSRQYLEEGLALCASQSSSVNGAASQPALLVICLSALAVTLCTLGYPAQALTHAQEALAMAHEHARPSLRALALHGAFLVCRDRQEIHSADVHAEALIRLCQEHGFSFWLAWGQTYQGWVRLEQGVVEEGMRLMQQGLAAVRAIGAEGRISNALAILAQAAGRAGQWEEGIATLNKTLRHVSIHGERYYEAEIYRLKGELMLQKGAGDCRLGADSLSPQAPSLQPPASSGVAREVEECFFKAIEIARRQQAKSLELRAVMSLVHLRQQQAAQHGSRNMHYVARTALAEARTMLAEVYGWFTEGFDVKDLQEAKALLKELNR